MRNLIEVFTEFWLLLFFILADLVLYYNATSGHSKVPFIAALVITVPATIITGLAAYQSFKHRNDKEPW
jgi:hypothetical protein